MIQVLKRQQKAWAHIVLKRVRKIRRKQVCCRKTRLRKFRPRKFRLIGEIAVRQFCRKTSIFEKNSYVLEVPFYTVRFKKYHFIKFGFQSFVEM